MSVLTIRLVPARLLASITGQIISMSLALGGVARLRTRALYEVVNKRRRWSYKLRLSLLAHEEVLFWQSSLLSLNGRPIWFSPSATRVVFSDASSTGYGGYHTVEIGPNIAHGQWSQYEATLSSTWRELKAVSVLDSFASKLAGTELNGSPTIKMLSELCRQEAAPTGYSSVHFYNLLSPGHPARHGMDSS